MNDATREYVRRFAAEAPPLSPAQRDLIRRIWAAALTTRQPDTPTRPITRTVQNNKLERHCPACGGTDNIPRVFITASEAADALGFAPGQTGTAGAQRVYKLIKSGRLRSVRLGRVLRIPASEIERLAGEA